MSAADLLTELTRRGVHVAVDGPDLRLQAPRGVLTPELRRRIQEHKQALLELVRERPPRSSEPAAAAPDHGARDPFPLTDVQEAYWIGRSALYGSGGVSPQAYFELETDALDLHRLEATWRQLVQRHDMLRAIFLEDGTQEICARVPDYAFEVEDLSSLTSEEIEARLDSLRRSRSRRVFPADTWPLFEIRALHMPGGVLRLCVCIDLLIADGMSVFVLFQEWGELYRGVELEPLQVSFRDYVLAEEAAKKTAAYRESEAYWKQRAQDLPPAPALPSIHAGEQPRFTHQTTKVDGEQWRILQDRARRADLTPATFLCAVYAEVLARWSKSDRFTLNLTVASRPPYHAQINRVVGEFTSLLLLEVEQKTGSFAERARSLGHRLTRDLDHYRVSGVRVLRTMNRSRASGDAVLMPFVFTSHLGQWYGRDGSAPLAWLGQIVYSTSQTPQVWLDHIVIEDGDGLAIHWDAAENRFPPGLVASLCESHTALLAELATDEAAWHSATRAPLPRAQGEQRARYNATRGPVPAGLLHTGFLDRAERDPSAIAIAAPDRRMTYRELLDRADQLARSLADAGARKNQLVAVVMDRGWEQVVACLGILMSGAAYLPIDPSLPSERISYLLDNGDVAIAITQPAVDRMGFWRSHIRRFVVADSPVAPGQGRRPVPEVSADDISADDLAYVIFTSGSSGRPKGVEISHLGALNTITDINERLDIGPTDKVLALSSLSFDLSVYDLFGTLAAGGTIVIPRASAGMDPAHWLSCIDEHQVTVWNSVPALAEILIDHVEQRSAACMARLRCFLLSGDWIPTTLPDRIRARAEAARVISLGGATEGSIWSIYYPIDQVDPAWKSIPYGRPLRNQTIHVLDTNLEPCPDWVPGELYIGGLGVAQGYWRDQEKTNAHFSRHPRTGERLYRTGDWGRFLPDGNVEFLGRQDLQVKIAGHRVELGEIEATLLRHPAIRQAFASVVGERADTRRLVAHVLFDLEGGPDREIDTRDLRAFLESELPAWMVPSELVPIASVPYTANGKVDRKQLLALAASRAEIARSSEPAPAAGQPVANALHGITELVIELLPDDQGELDRDASFVSLGITSIQLIKLAGKLEQRFGHRPEMARFLSLDSVAKLASYYEHRHTTDAHQASTSSLALGRDLGEPWPELFDRERLEEFRRERPGRRRFDPGTERLRLEGPAIDQALLARYLERRSHRTFAQTPMTQAQLGRLLSALRELEIDGKPKYLYASAHDSRSVQTYLLAKAGRIEGLASGFYYYDPVSHELALVSRDDGDWQSAYVFENRAIFAEAAFALFLVVDLDAIVPLHGNRSIEYALIESGLIAQLLETTAPETDLGLCQIGYVDTSRIGAALHLGENHLLLHSLLGGPRASGESAETSDEPFPLTDMQQAYWLGRQHHYELGGVSAYAYFELESEQIDLPRLERAWRRLVARHEMLRAMVSSDGQQKILGSVPEYVIDVTDLREQPESEATRRLADERARMSHQVLPLDQWPLFEIRAYRLANPDRVRVFVGLDMLIMDAQSFLCLFHEWRALYEDQDLVLPPIGYSFRSHVRAHRAAVGSARYQRDLAYWQEKLPALPAGPDFAAGRETRASTATPRFSRRTSRLEPDQWQRFVASATKRRISPSMALCTAYAKVIATWSRNARFSLNLTLLGRPDVHPDIGKVIGDFTSGLLLEVDDTTLSTVREHAHELQQQFWRNMEHASVGTVQVLRELARVQGRVDASMPVVFTSLLDQTASTQHGAVSPTAWLGHQVFGVSQTPQVCLDHQVYEQEGALVFHWDGVESRFDGRLDDMFSAYVALISRLAMDDTAWDAAPLKLLPPEQLATRERVNATDAPVSSELLHTLFTQRARIAANHLAVVDGQERLTYADIDRLSNQLAGRLRQHPSVKPNALVGVIMEKGWEQVVAVLAIHKAGAAYLPLDPALPPERLGFLLRDGNVGVVVTSERGQGAPDIPLDIPLDIPPDILKDIECLQVGKEALAHLDDRACDTRQSPRDLAYVIYTSGSTGTPKGVMIDHQGAVNTILDINDRGQVSSSDRILAVSALNFDLSVYDIFGTLAAGGTIVLPSGAAHDAEGWAGLVREHRITLWSSVPVLLEMLLEVLERGGERCAPSLRLLLLSGDWIPLTLPPRAIAQSPEAKVVSLGGATEASIWSIFYPIEDIDPSWNSVPYGVPLRNQRFHVLDDKLEPCPDGVPGHLYIGGVGLAQGYWRDPQRSAASFVTHPRTGERLYRTGDWGRYARDGNIEFLGRTDHQVKILGHRIECGEIEAALREHTRVQDAIVSVSDTPGRGKQLIAYLLLSSAGDIDPVEMRSFLQRKLPAYMVPAHFVSLTSWPLSANGKVDRRALPSPTLSERHGVAPDSAAEKAVAALLGQILEVPVTNVASNFFELGGDSLRALRLATLLGDTFEVEVSIRQILEDPTVAGIAELVEELIIEQVSAPAEDAGGES